LDRSASDDSYRPDAPPSTQSTDDSPRREDAGSRATPDERRHPPLSPQIPISLGDVDAESAPESLNAASAVPGETRTVRSMTTNGLSLKHQSDTLVANIRGRHDRSLATVKPPRVELARILPLTAPAPALDLAPVTRAIGATGRIRATLAGQPLGALLGWAPGPLSIELHGPWVVLRADASSRVPRRNDGRCAYLDDQRLRVTEAVCVNLGLRFGDEVSLLALRDEGALALTNPSRLLLGAPLALATTARSTRELVG